MTKIVNVKNIVEENGKTIKKQVRVWLNIKWKTDKASKTGIST